jgi:hypothetical protein
MVLLVLVQDESQGSIWVPAALGPDGIFGYTQCQYTFIPSAIYNDYYGFIVEHSNGANRVLCYDLNQMQTMFSVDGKTINYYPLAELVPYSHNLGSSVAITATFQLNAAQYAEANAKWLQTINPQPLVPVIVMSEQEWLQNNFMLQQMVAAKQHADYLAYVAKMQAIEAAEKSKSLQEKLLDLTSKLENMSTSAFSPFTDESTTSNSPSDLLSLDTPPQFEKKTFAVEPANQHPESMPEPKRITTVAAKPKLSKEMRRQQQLLQAKMSLMQFNELQDKYSGSLDAALGFISNNEYLKQASAGELIQFLTASNLRLEICINLLSKKSSVLRPKVIKALFHKLVSYAPEDLEKHKLPQNLINAAQSFKNDDPDFYAKIVKVVNAYKPLPKEKPKKIEAAPSASEPSVVVPKVQKMPLESKSNQHVKPTKADPVETVVAILNSFDPDQYNEFVAKPEHKLRSEDLIKPWGQLLSSVKDFEKLRVLVQKATMDRELCANIFTRNFKSFSASSKDLLLEKALTYSGEDFLFFFHEIRTVDKFNVYYNDLKNRNPQHFSEIEGKYSDCMRLVAEKLSPKLQAGDKGLLQTLQKYKLMLNVVNSDNKTLLMLALQNKNIDPKIVEYLIENSNESILHVDSAGRSALHYWADNRGKQIDLFEKLYRKVVAETEVANDIVITNAAQVDIPARISALKDSSGQTFLHVFLAKNKHPQEVLAAINIIVSETGDSLLGLSIIAKDQHGQNAYNILEKLPEFNEAVDILGSSMIEISSYLTDDVLKLKHGYFGSDIYDFFSLASKPNVIDSLLAKMPDKKATDRLFNIVQRRMQLRGDIHTENRNLREVFAIHDITEDLYQLYACHSADSEAKMVNLLIKWMFIEEYGTAGNLVEAIIYDAIQLKNIDLQSALLRATDLIDRIIHVQTEEQRAATLSSSSSLGNVVLIAILSLIIKTAEDEKALQILQKLLISGADCTIQNESARNILHVFLSCYIKGTISAKTLQVLSASISSDTMDVLLKQTSNKGSLPMAIVPVERISEVESILRPATGPKLKATF